MAPPPVATPQREEDGRLRLSKLMSEKGLASRREADEWIEHGWVRVDGEVVSELGSRVFPDQVITIDPLARTQQSERVTILIHKPIGYVSGQAEDGYEPAVVLITPENRWSEDKMPMQLTRGHLRHLAPAGRLDIDSTGMLVLTQDGRIAKHLIGEDSGVEKEYLVRVEYMDDPEAENVSAVVPPEAIEYLRFGMELDGRQLKQAQVSWQNEQQLRFVLREGRKRQIRRMCEQVGLKVVGLKRVRMGSVTLGKLPLGQWRFMRPDERF
jgi:23S rRNA pseudouridine2604 synthase